MSTPDLALDRPRTHRSTTSFRNSSTTPTTLITGGDSRTTTSTAADPGSTYALLRAPWRLVPSQVTWDQRCDRVSEWDQPPSVDGISKEAQERLQAIEQDDVDELFVLRVGRTERVWGIRELNVFGVLWWAPDHTVDPMDVAGNQGGGKGAAATLLANV